MPLLRFDPDAELVDVDALAIVVRLRFFAMDGCLHLGLFIGIRRVNFWGFESFLKFPFVCVTL